MASAGTIAAIACLLIGIVIFIIGLVLFEINHNKKKKQEPYVYILLFGGLTFAIISGVFLAYATRKAPPAKSNAL